MTSLLSGFVLGFTVAASPGPIFLVCLRRTLIRGWLTGVVSGLGVATADGFYGTLAAFGVTEVTAALVSQRRWLTLIGGAALVVLGLRAALARPATRDGEGGAPGPRLAWAYFSTLGLTITNPATILAFAAFFTSLGLGLPGRSLSPVVLLVGVLLGSAPWWLVLASGAALLHARVTPAVLKGIGILSGLAILAFGLVAIATSLGAR